MCRGDVHGPRLRGVYNQGPTTSSSLPVATMTDNRTMAEMLRAPTEGCAEAIIVPPILAEQFKIKHSLVNMITSEQFFGLEKDNPHDHVRAARRWLEKEPPHLITTWDDLAWERYKDLLRACPHHGFTELHELDTFYNALNPADQDSLNAAAGGKLLEKSPQDVLPVSCHRWLRLLRKSVLPAEVLIRTTSVLPPVDTLFQNTETTSKFTFQQPQIDMVKNELRNEMKTSIQTSLSNQTNEIKNMMASLLQMNTASTSESGTLPSNTVANPKGELKAITTRSGLVTKGPTVPNPPKSVNPEEDECVEETDHRVPLILGRPFLRTARALIDVHGEEMIL
nr:hypothetical protein [Tanacetum cinerariifolium]